MLNIKLQIHNSIFGFVMVGFIVGSFHFSFAAGSLLVSLNGALERSQKAGGGSSDLPFPWMLSQAQQPLIPAAALNSSSQPLCIFLQFHCAHQRNLAASFLLGLKFSSIGSLLQAPFGSREAATQFPCPRGCGSWFSAATSLGFWLLITPTYFLCQPQCSCLLQYLHCIIIPSFWFVSPSVTFQPLLCIHFLY